MKIRYFADTDTLLIVFRDAPVAETRDLEEDMLLTSVGWANSYYMDTQPYVDEWGVGWILQRCHCRQHE